MPKPKQRLLTEYEELQVRYLLGVMPLRADPRTLTERIAALTPAARAMLNRGLAAHGLQVAEVKKPAKKKPATPKPAAQAAKRK